MGDRIVSRWSNLNGRYIGPIKKMRDKVYSVIDYNDHNNEYVIEDMIGSLHSFSFRCLLGRMSSRIRFYMIEYII